MNSLLVKKNWSIVSQSGLSIMWQNKCIFFEYISWTINKIIQKKDNQNPFFFNFSHLNYTYILENPNCDIMHKLILELSINNQ